jgi:hypothetical protein
MKTFLRGRYALFWEKKKRKKALTFSGVPLVNECLARKLVSLLDKEESTGDTQPPGLWIKKERENPRCLLNEYEHTSHVQWSPVWFIAQPTAWHRLPCGQRRSRLNRK